MLLNGGFIIPPLLTNVSALPRETWTRKLCLFSTPQACVFSWRMWVAACMREGQRLSLWTFAITDRLCSEKHNSVKFIPVWLDIHLIECRSVEIEKNDGHITKVEAWTTLTIRGRKTGHSQNADTGTLHYHGAYSGIVLSTSKVPSSPVSSAQLRLLISAPTYTVKKVKGDHPVSIALTALRLIFVSYRSLAQGRFYGDQGVRGAAAPQWKMSPSVPHFGPASIPRLSLKYTSNILNSAAYCAPPSWNCGPPLAPSD